MRVGRAESGRVPATTPGHLLALIRSRPVWTRQELLDATGMSRPTLLARLAALVSAGLVYESGSASSTGGRPAQLIRFDDRELLVLTLDIGQTRAAVSVTDIHGRELACARRPVNAFEDAPDDLLGPLLAEGERLLAETGRGRLVGVGMSLPAPIRPDTGLPHTVWTMPRWRDYPIPQRIAALWDVPLVLENDARAMALGEAGVDDANTLLAVKWSSGIGAGLVIGGECLVGEDGAAGDIGHLRVGRGTRRCRCGQRGCLAAYASGYALVTSLRLRSVDELAERARARDERVCAALSEAAELVGVALASMITMVNPGVLVLNGTIGVLPGIVTRVGRTLRATALSRSTENLRVVSSGLGERAVTTGLAQLVANRVLHPDAVDESLAAGSPPAHG
ncbi:ROK family transcriptional regulator [Goodfellowiella coeruleoviolacea]|uniref:Sugar kinase of the NBD/HSP70 family, may containing an N-terminal HTH domain n=1 Tax=Goodfellowiella coeruleoviolacea TaxID=334858 RepID=A0AAE3KJ13_9PSEU|nr:ROK family protein [Goodfellowiella coeruleoviolacea]MCP2168562.1 Sugar kinase of the NBD/HSP70 family, may containing an N-terminal HTH domain [Goodfellowiella coeruleoviolacea]